MPENQMQRGQQWLEQLLQQVGLPAAVSPQIQTPTPELESCWLTIDSQPLTPEQIQLLIGAEGTVLDSIQYLANTILNIGQPPEAQQAYTIELNGYRARRQAELQRLAVEAAEQVRATGVEFEMKSLSSAERRQVHTFLKVYEDIETESRGREPDRRLVVRRLVNS
ncbi:RNA-binding protein [Desertifilum sp. FACHB-1129]|uniref:RNA-binding protein n=1 Tax=Desertifilum tharense IPPAS B-1220 TaxID=1781255 RepID=A0A1E5QMU3_9CYAN|nr:MULTISPECIES: R3H domain-containing nucleic acid-binding protein [Desertifilum]MDA0208856.1 RNA-binding protein [Cyanobacteria bacterium FC1]MBD2311057.1 RNA-binding protein [Desertifilum sp. FACHB-1129]MBD2321462.1 RNA-binding protein [Desertifilum sp. FACHB-866]MBD2331231.1 RNA-binding protein [Desertifilum sp. FACHB-868]OEJ75995.1 RNA-binding protein [Desertifilum tharense IPPAS B-1220]